MMMHGQILDVGHNNLADVSIGSLMESKLNLLDLSMNSDLKLDPSACEQSLPR